MDTTKINIYHSAEQGDTRFCGKYDCRTLWACLVILICGAQVWLYHAQIPLVSPLKSMIRTTAKFSLVNNYGPFAVMTTIRNEIVLQGSNDALHWSEYQFKYKPGELNHELGWNIPHQPRLDWQMWFATLGVSGKGSWFDSFLIKILNGSPQVLSLLKKNPFPEKPPNYVRAILYRYSYASRQQYADNGELWQRQYKHIYWPVTSLDAN